MSASSRFAFPALPAWWEVHVQDNFNTAQLASPLETSSFDVNRTVLQKTTHVCRWQQGSYSSCLMKLIVHNYALRSNSSASSTHNKTSTSKCWCHTQKHHTLSCDSTSMGHKGGFSYSCKTFTVSVIARQFKSHISILIPDLSLCKKIQHMPKQISIWL